MSTTSQPGSHPFVNEVVASTAASSDHAGMRTLLIVLGLAACGSVQQQTPDAPPPADAAPPGDAAPPVDAAPAAPDPMKYCMDIQANCMAANAQYPSMDQCLATAAALPVGMAADQAGNTLACRQYHAGAPSMMTPTVHCIHAGPGGDQVGSPGVCGDACTSFCSLEIKVCGSTDAPLNGITAQYQNMASCLTACASFDKTHKYVLNGTPAAPAGDSLACRLYHVTNAALFAKQGNLATASAHCGHTAVAQPPGSPCSGTPAP